MTRSQRTGFTGLLALVAVAACLVATPPAGADEISSQFQNQSTNIHVTLPELSFAETDLSGGTKPCVYNLTAEATLTRPAGSSTVHEAGTVKGSTGCPRYPTVQLSIVDSSLGLPTYSTGCGPKTATTLGGPVSCSASQDVGYSLAGVPRAESEVTYQFSVSRGGVQKGCIEYTVRMVYGTQATGTPEPC